MMVASALNGTSVKLLPLVTIERLSVEIVYWPTGAFIVLNVIVAMVYKPAGSVSPPLLLAPRSKSLTGLSTHAMPHGLGRGCEFGNGEPVLSMPVIVKRPLPAALLCRKKVSPLETKLVLILSVRVND